LRGGRRLGSPALVADGNHARADGLVSLSVLASAGLVALGFDLADPLIGLLVALVILRVTWQSLRTIREGPGGRSSPGAAGTSSGGASSRPRRGSRGPSRRRPGPG